MGTKKTTDTTQHQTQQQTQSQASKQSQQSVFEPGSLETYKRLQPQLTGFFDQYLNAPLTETPGYQEGARVATEAAGQLGARGIYNVNQNILASGYGGRISPGYQQELLQRAGYNTSALQSNAFLQNYLNQLGIRNQVAGMAEGFRPLQTGATSEGTSSGTSTGTLDSQGHTVERTSGLGTFLPQIAGAAIGGLTGGLGVGAFALARNLFRGAAGQPTGGSGGGFANFPSGYGGFSPFLQPFNPLVGLQQPTFNLPNTYPGSNYTFTPTPGAP